MLPKDKNKMSGLSLNCPVGVIKLASFNLIQPKILLPVRKGIQHKVLFIRAEQGVSILV